MKKKKEISFAALLISALPALVMFAAFFIVRDYRNAVDHYVDYFSMPVRLALGRVSSRVPFSIAEICYALIVILPVIYIVRSVILIKRSDGKIRTLLKRIIILCIVVLYIAAIYTALFGVDYYKLPFAKRAGIDTDSVTLSELRAVTCYFVDMANEYSQKVTRNEIGVFDEPLDNIFAFADQCYNGIYATFPMLKGEIFTPKRIICSKIMSYVGFTGVYFPFTGESNINIDSPHSHIPATIAHEIAHQKGITDESECNFIGIVASCSSGNDAYIYSGYLSGLTHLMNTLYYEDAEMWNMLKNDFSPELTEDWNESIRYWDKMDVPISDFFSDIYDAYLKSYGQKLGVVSYSACIKLIVAYYIDRIPPMYIEAVEEVYGA